MPKRSSAARDSAPPRRSPPRLARLSTAEKVLSFPYPPQSSVMSFLRQEEALPLRSASVACRDVVAAHVWGAEYGGSSRIMGSLASWRRCFPNATWACVSGARESDEFAHLSGVIGLDITDSVWITDAYLAHLTGITALHMAGCVQITDAGLAHLTGIHTLNMSGCNLITDAGLAHLSGINTLSMNNCTQITDAGLQYLDGIYILNMYGCYLVTNEGRSKLRTWARINPWISTPERVFAFRGRLRGP